MEDIIGSAIKTPLKEHAYPFLESVKKGSCFPEVFQNRRFWPVFPTSFRCSVIETIFGVLGAHRGYIFVRTDDVLVLHFGNGGSTSNFMEATPLVGRVCV